MSRRRKASATVRRPNRARRASGCGARRSRASRPAQSIGKTVQGREINGAGANVIELDEEDIRIAADLTGVAKDGKEVAHRPQQQRTEPDGSESISARLANVAVEGTPQAQETAEFFRRLIAVVGAHWH